MSDFVGRSFVEPKKAILSKSDLEQFQNSAACKAILDFIKLMAESVIGTSIKDPGYTVSPLVRKFELAMRDLNNLVDECPPIKQPMRFGNKAFRQWHERLSQIVSKFLEDEDVLPQDRRDAAVELTPYFMDLFGNVTRIDYGTGHELNFVIIFLIFYRLRLIEKSDLTSVVLVGFASYIRTMRRLQVDYMLEPAGSHGVWGLDDYHCLLFLLGSAQLSLPSNSNEGEQSESTLVISLIRPTSIHEEETLRMYSDEFIYLEGIAFIKQIKSSAPFAETSPMLNDISAIGDWGKICSRLMKLFKGEVLFKFPVVQHLLFGSILSASEWEDKRDKNEGNKMH